MHMTGLLASSYLVCDNCIATGRTLRLLDVRKHNTMQQEDVMMRVFENGLVFRKQIETALHSGFESTLLKRARQDVMHSKIENTGNLLIHLKYI